MKLVSIGEGTADYFPSVEKTFPGGISLNFAVQAKRCGADSVSFVSVVGPDEHGRIILDHLNREGIDASHVHRSSQPSAWCEIVILPGGERYFPPNSYHQNCMASFSLTAGDLNFIRQHDVVVSRYDRAYADVYFEQVMTDPAFHGRRVADFGDWFDYDGDHAQVFPYFPFVDLAFISGDEATIQALGPKALASEMLLVVTRGKAGSSAFIDGERIDCPAVDINPKLVVDTTGAGDAFQAAFTVSYFMRGDVSEALAAGAAQAAKTVQHIGAT